MTTHTGVLQMYEMHRCTQLVVQHTHTPSNRAAAKYQRWADNRVTAAELWPTVPPDAFTPLHLQTADNNA